MEKRHGEGDGDGIDRKWGFLTFSILGVLLRLMPEGSKGGFQREPVALAHSHWNGNEKVDVTAPAR